MVQSGFTQLTQLTQMKSFLSLSDLEKGIHAFFSSRFDYTVKHFILGSAGETSKDFSWFKTLLPGF